MHNQSTRSNKQATNPTAPPPGPQQLLRATSTLLSRTALLAGDLSKDKILDRVCSGVQKVAKEMEAEINTRASEGERLMDLAWDQARRKDFYVTARDCMALDVKEEELWQTEGLMENPAEMRLLMYYRKRERPRGTYYERKRARNRIYSDYKPKPKNSQNGDFGQDLGLGGSARGERRHDLVDLSPPEAPEQPEEGYLGESDYSTNQTQPLGRELSGIVECDYEGSSYPKQRVEGAGGGARQVKRALHFQQEITEKKPSGMSGVVGEGSREHFSGYNPDFGGFDQEGIRITKKNYAQDLAVRGGIEGAEQPQRPAETPASPTKTPLGSQEPLTQKPVSTPKKVIKSHSGDYEETHQETSANGKTQTTRYRRQETFVDGAHQKVVKQVIIRTTSQGDIPFDDKAYLKHLDGDLPESMKLHLAEKSQFSLTREIALNHPEMVSGKGKDSMASISVNQTETESVQIMKKSKNYQEFNIQSDATRDLRKGISGLPSHSRVMESSGRSGNGPESGQIISDINHCFKVTHFENQVDVSEESSRMDQPIESNLEHLEDTQNQLFGTKSAERLQNYKNQNAGNLESISGSESGQRNKDSHPSTQNDHKTHTFGAGTKRSPQASMSNRDELSDQRDAVSATNNSKNHSLNKETGQIEAEIEEPTQLRKSMSEQNKGAGPLGFNSMATKEYATPNIDAGSSPNKTLRRISGRAAYSELLTHPDNKTQYSTVIHRQMNFQPQGSHSKAPEDEFGGVFQETPRQPSGASRGSQRVQEGSSCLSKRATDHIHDIIRKSHQVSSGRGERVQNVAKKGYDSAVYGVNGITGGAGLHGGVLTKSGLQRHLGALEAEERARAIQQQGNGQLVMQSQEEISPSSMYESRAQVPAQLPHSESRKSIEPQNLTEAYQQHSVHSKSQIRESQSQSEAERTSSLSHRSSSEYELRPIPSNQDLLKPSNLVDANTYRESGYGSRPQMANQPSMVSVGRLFDQGLSQRSSAVQETPKQAANASHTYQNVMNQRELILANRARFEKSSFPSEARSLCYPAGMMQTPKQSKSSLYHPQSERIQYMNITPEKMNTDRSEGGSKVQEHPDGCQDASSSLYRHSMVRGSQAALVEAERASMRSSQQATLKQSMASSHHSDYSQRSHQSYQNTQELTHQASQPSQINTEDMAALETLKQRQSERISSQQTPGLINTSHGTGTLNTETLDSPHPQNGEIHFEERKGGSIQQDSNEYPQSHHQAYHNQTEMPEMVQDISRRQSTNMKKSRKPSVVTSRNRASASEREPSKEGPTPFFGGVGKYGCSEFESEQKTQNKGLFGGNIGSKAVGMFTEAKEAFFGAQTQQSGQGGSRNPFGGQQSGGGMFVVEKGAGGGEGANLFGAKSGAAGGFFTCNTQPQKTTGNFFNRTNQSLTAASNNIFGGVSAHAQTPQHDHQQSQDSKSRSRGEESRRSGLSVRFSQKSQQHPLPPLDLTQRPSHSSRAQQEYPSGHPQQPQEGQLHPGQVDRNFMFGQQGAQHESQLISHMTDTTSQPNLRSQVAGYEQIEGGITSRTDGQDPTFRAREGQDYQAGPGMFGSGNNTGVMG